MKNSLKHIRILGVDTHNFLADLSYIASLTEAYTSISATIGFQTFRVFPSPLQKKKLIVFTSKK